MGTACCVICGIGRLWDDLSQVNLEQQYVESHNLRETMTLPDPACHGLPWPDAGLAFPSSPSGLADRVGGELAPAIGHSSPPGN